MIGARRPQPGSTAASRLNGAIDPEKHVLPLNGTREGLFLALFPLMPLTKDGAQAHRGDAQSLLSGLCRRRAGHAGAEPLYVPVDRGELAFCPITRACRKTTLERLAAVYICSPSNPEGAVASEDYWRQLFALAERHDFIVLADECYADIYFDQPPPSRAARAAEADRAASPAFSPFIRCPSAPACRACAPAWWRATPS